MKNFFRTDEKARDRMCGLEDFKLDFATRFRYWVFDVSAFLGTAIPIVCPEPILPLAIGLNL